MRPYNGRRPLRSWTLLQPAVNKTTVLGDSSRLELWLENLATGVRESTKRAAARQDWPKGWAMTVFRLGVLLLMNHRHAPHGGQCKYAMRNAEPSN